MRPRTSEGRVRQVPVAVLSFTGIAKEYLPATHEKKSQQTKNLVTNWPQFDKEGDGGFVI